MVLYVSNQGEIACGKNARHGGAYLAALAKNHPVSIDTPLDTWKRMPPAVVEHQGLTCESCDREQRPYPLPRGVIEAENSC